MGDYRQDMGVEKLIVLIQNCLLVFALPVTVMIFLRKKAYNHIVLYLQKYNNS